MALHQLSDEELERRVKLIEKRIWTADPKDLPIINQIFQQLIEEQVRRDMSKGASKHVQESDVHHPVPVRDGQLLSPPPGVQSEATLL